MSKKIRLAGRRVLDRLASPIKINIDKYKTDPLDILGTDVDDPVTSVIMRYILENGVEGGHSLFQVKYLNSYYNFYWCDEKGLFNVAYVEKFYFLFPSLRSIVDSVGEDELFEGLYLASEDWDEVWEEIGKIPDS